MTTTIEAATDPTTIAIEQVASLVSKNQGWQESIAKYSAEEAREFIKKGYMEPPDGLIEHPWAIVFELPGTAWERRASGVTMPRGELFLRLIRPTGSEDTELEERNFNNWHGAIAKELSRYEAAGYHLTATLTDAPQHAAPQDRPTQSWWDVGYTIAWGAF